MDLARGSLNHQVFVVVTTRIFNVQDTNIFVLLAAAGMTSTLSPGSLESRNLPVLKILTIFVIDIKDHLMLEVIAINTFGSSSDAFDSIRTKSALYGQ